MATVECFILGRRTRGKEERVTRGVQFMLPEEADIGGHVVERGSRRNISVGGRVTGGLCGRA